MFCYICGSQLPDGARFCLNCGTSLADVASSQGQQSSPPPTSATSIVTIHGYKEWYAVKPAVQIFDGSIYMGEVKYNDTTRIVINHETTLSFKAMMRKATFHVVPGVNYEIQLSFNRLTGALSATRNSDINAIPQPTQQFVNNSAPQPQAAPNATEEFGNYDEDFSSDVDASARCIYINNNSLGNVKVFDALDNCLAKVKHAPISNKYILVDDEDEFLMRIDEIDPLNHVFALSVDESGELRIAEIAPKGNAQLGFGLVNTISIPFASIPFGAYYGVSGYGDIVVKKNGKYHEMYMNQTFIARAEMKKGYVASVLSSKSRLEMFTDNDDFIAYAVGIFLMLDINSYCK